MDSLGAPARKPPAKRGPRELLKRENLRVAGAGVLGVLLTLFAVFNLNQVEVNWLLGTWETPLIIVVLLSALIGMGIDRILVRRSGAKKKTRRAD